MVTIGPCPQRREGVRVVELDDTRLSPEATAWIDQTRPFVDRFPKAIQAVLDEQGLERVGLPTLAVADMREGGYENVHLTLRGVDPEKSLSGWRTSTTATTPTSKPGDVCVIT
ncbi:hypothetical protein [Nocardiopsis halotolerans]|uniref:hypothetical protein n=1 Tax=Nocardiopsis halotolerans TaxID=124252 RepID=UPI001268BF4E|nr:hypothetical protein [Nocardiopsis halotolerans]